MTAIRRACLRATPPLADILARLNQELAGRYAVEREIGRGGMAVVYLATDLRHKRPVAIKVLSPETAGPDAAERFTREIQTVAQLHHPHILPLHDSGVAGDRFFYVMPFVEGESLRQRLDREGPLPVVEATRIAREVADALAFAHARGVVHRDIKPANILLSAGHAAVADFGIARAINAAGIVLSEESRPRPMHKTEMTLTGTGMAMGTPVYMSPEQATPSGVDGRADQYSLGCVVYEMLAGKPPFSGPNAQAVLARHSMDPAPSLRSIRRSLPREIEPPIMRALAKNPAERWPDTREFAVALEAGLSRAGAWRRRAAAILLVALAGPAVYLWNASRAPATVPDVGVLPFELSGDTSFADLAEGLREELTKGLSRVAGLKTRGTGQMTAYRGQDPIRVGRDLGLTMVVTARVHAANDRIRVSPQLVRVSDGSVVWSGENLDGTVEADGQTVDLFAIQNQLGERIVGAILPRLTVAQRAVAVRGARTTSAAAWRKYLEARRLMFIWTEPSIARAKALLDEAIALDSSFSDAWAALGNTLDGVAHFSSRDPRYFEERMDVAINKAVALDPLGGYALAQRAINRVLSKWEWDSALVDLERARQLEPGSFDVQAAYQGLLAWLDMSDSALTLARQYHDTTSIDSWSNLSWTFMGAGLWDSALVAAERVRGMDTSYVGNNLTLAHAYLFANRRAEADEAMARFVRLVARQSDDIGHAATYYRRTGDRAGITLMRKRLDSLKTRTSWSVNSAEAMVRLALGDREGALTYLERAVDAHEYMVPAMMSFALDPLRNEPRFRAVKERVWGRHSLPRVLKQ